MRRIILVMLLAIVSLASRAQLIHYGFKIGGGLASQSIKNTSILYTSSLRTFNAEVFAQIPVKYNFTVQAGLSLTNKGVIIFEDALTTTNKITYMEVPVMLVRKIELSSLGKLAFGAGPYIARGLKGSFDYETPSSATSDKVKFGNENDFKQMDTGISVMTNLELNNKLTFNLGYELGLQNIAAQTPKDTGTKSVYNREFTVSLGFIF